MCIRAGFCAKGGSDSGPVSAARRAYAAAAGDQLRARRAHLPLLHLCNTASLLPFGCCHTPLTHAMSGRGSPWNGFWGIVVLAACIIIAGDRLGSKLVGDFKPAADEAAAALTVISRVCVGACPNCGKPKPCSVCGKQTPL